MLAQDIGKDSQGLCMRPSTINKQEFSAFSTVVT